MPNKTLAAQHPPLSLLKIVETSRKPQFPRAVPISSGRMVTILFALVSLLVFEAERHWSSSLSHCDIRWSSCAGNAVTDFGSFPPTGSCGSGFTECGRRSSKPWYSSNRRLWSSGSQRLSDLLAMAITLSRTAQDERRNTRPDPSNERRQPALGRTSRPRRTAQAWHRRQSGYRWKVSASAPQGSPPTWRSFLRNHMTVIVAVDMFVVATATFRVLYAVIVLDHHRRRVIHFEVTRNPTQVWLAQQITEAFSWDTAPRYLLRHCCCCSIQVDVPVRQRGHWPPPAPLSTPQFARSARRFPRAAG